MSSGEGPAEKMATQQSQQTDADRSRELATNDQNLSQFDGPADQSPLYRSLVQSGRSSTSDAYTSAKNAVRANAHAAGYGYEQPVTQTTDAGMERSEANDLSAVPRNAEATVTQDDLQAAGIRAGEVSSLNPSSLTSTAVSGETAQRNTLMSTLLGVGKLGTQIGEDAAGV